MTLTEGEIALIARALRDYASQRRSAYYTTNLDLLLELRLDAIAAEDLAARIVEAEVVVVTGKEL